MINRSFFKFFFGFVSIIAIVLAIIFIVGTLSDDPRAKALEVEILDQRANK